MTVFLSILKSCPPGAGILHNSASGYRICPHSFLLTVSLQLPGGFSCWIDMATGRCPLRITGILTITGSSACLQDITAPGDHPYPLCCSPGKEIHVKAVVTLLPASSLTGRRQGGSWTTWATHSWYCLPEPQFVLVQRNCAWRWNAFLHIELALTGGTFQPQEGTWH